MTDIKNKIELVENDYISEIDSNLKPRHSDLQLALVKEKELNLGDFKIFYNKEFDIGYTNPVVREDLSYLLYSDRKISDFSLKENYFITLLKDYFAKKLIKKITKNKNITSVLDFATGNARFAYLSSKVLPNSEVIAMDFQQEEPPLVKKSSNIKYCKIENSLQPINGKYDLIILRHVLEHSYYPVQLLSNLSNNLTDNGLIYIEVPNLDSGCIRLLKNFPTYHPPYHIFHFTKKSLAKVFEKAGLEGKIVGNNMPMMGNWLSEVFNCRSNLIFKLSGIAFHPLQILIEKLFLSSTCLNVLVRKKL